MKRWLVPFLLGALPTLAGGDGVPQPVRVCAGTEIWKKGVAPFPPAVEVAVLEGDPAATGHFTARVKLPKGFTLGAHTHPGDERATVVSGVIWVGAGRVADKAHATRLPAGSFYVNPKGLVHFFIVEEETVLQISTEGPWGTQKVE